MLIIAKLDRLSRSAAFPLTLRDAGVRFMACDMSEADDPTVGIMAICPRAGARGDQPRARGRRYRRSGRTG